MENFTVHVTWSVWANIQIEADSLEEAMRIVEETLPTPQNHHYIEDSFEIDEDHSRFLLDSAKDSEQVTHSTASI